LSWEWWTLCGPSAKGRNVCPHRFRSRDHLHSCSTTFSSELPFDQLPRYLQRDRDGNYGRVFRETALGLGIEELLCAPRSPWQNAYAERLIGSIRRECLDHVIVFHEPGVRRVLRSYSEYYQRARTHLSLGKDSPELRLIEPREMGRAVAPPQVGGLHHRYQRLAA
jgi:transposase InsO family protein